MGIDGTVRMMTHTCTCNMLMHLSTFIHTMCTTEKYKLLLHCSVMTLIQGSVLTLYCCYRTLALMLSDDGTEVKCQWWSPAQSND